MYTQPYSALILARHNTDTFSNALSNDLLLYTTTPRILLGQEGECSMVVSSDSVAILSTSFFASNIYTSNATLSNVFLNGNIWSQCSRDGGITFNSNIVFQIIQNIKNITTNEFIVDTQTQNGSSNISNELVITYGFVNDSNAPYLSTDELVIDKSKEKIVSTSSIVTFDPKFYGSVLINGRLVLNNNDINYAFSTTYLDVTNTLGIGRQATYQLDMSTDNARKLTTTTWLTGSDRRVKNNIEDADIDICYSNIQKIKLRRFSWNSNIPNYKYVGDKTAIGWIAQEVEQYYPKSIQKCNDNGFDDFMNLNSDQLFKCTYGALQKAIMNIDNMQSLIINMQSQICDILSRI